MCTRRFPTTFLFIALAPALAFIGCPAAESAAPRPRQVAVPPAKIPFPYESLDVRNSCFVESVHFYDAYQQWRATASDGGDAGWARVLQWGHLDDTSAVGLGHAVALCMDNGKLWMYDVNFGLSKLSVPASRRGDLTDVGPEVYAKYPQINAVLGRYRDDAGRISPAAAPAPFLENDKNEDIRDATRVASELGRFRRARVFLFDYKDSRGRMRHGAATAFSFSNRLCVYFPDKGTHLSSRMRAVAVEDLRVMRGLTRRIYPGVLDVRWLEAAPPPDAKMAGTSGP
ncbi:hypothetical protein OH491_25860 [Termitidicoccus mucosus]